MPEVRTARLVSLGIEPLDDREGTVVLPRALGTSDTSRLIDVLSAERRDGSVLIIASTGVSATTRRRLRLARAAVEHGRVGVVLTGLPPLAARALVSQARELLDAGALGWAHAAVTLLERRYTALALLASVTGLRHPQPRFGQHLASLLPGTVFLAVSHPTAMVRRLRTGQPLDVALPPEPSDVVVSPPGDGSDRLRAVAEAAVGSDARVVPTVDEDHWGTNRVVEAAWYPRLTADRCAELHAAIQLRDCAWCGGRVASAPCAFCAMDRRRPAA